MANARGTETSVCERRLCGAPNRIQHRGQQVPADCTCELPEPESLRVVLVDPRRIWQRDLERMGTLTHIDEKAYGQLLRRALPHVIRDKDEYERLANELLRLDELEAPSP